MSAVTAPSGAIVGTTDSQTMTNKTISGTVNTVTNVSTAAFRPALYIPCFIYPSAGAGLANYTRIAALKTLCPNLDIYVAINENNGDFSARNADFAAGAVILDNAGCKVVGYTYTLYGARSSATVQTVMDNYATYYPEVRGIFFDEMENVPGEESYYTTLNNYAHNTKGYEITIGNPGTSTATSYVNTVDNILIYEVATLPTTATLNTRTFTGAYSRRYFGAIPYGVSSITTYGIRALMPYIGMFYATTDTLSNPWDSLPSYLETLAVIIANGP